MTRTARDKLNGWHIGVAVGVAALVGAACESWPLFVLVAAALIAAGLFTGKIRPPADHRPSRRSSSRRRR